MINRSALKYSIKKILPKRLFGFVLFLWQKAFLGIVQKIDMWRLRKFNSYRAIHLTHKNKDFSLFISPKNGFIDKHIFLYGVYEPFILDLFSRYLKPGDVFVDIGANIGQHSMYAASLVGERGKVHAFEPIPAIYNQIIDSVKANHFEKCVTVHNLALGSEDSIEKFYVSRNVGGSSLVNEDETTETFDVKVQRGDDALSTISTVNLVKIDVEGYEYEVLSGIKETLVNKKPVLLVEFSGDFYTKQAKGHGEKILGLLRECGYSLFDIEDNSKEVINDIAFEKEISTIRKQTNLLCLKK